MLRQFLIHGGRETFASYGIDRATVTASSLEDLGDIVAKAVPAEDIAFLSSFEDSVTIGDYHFVHAGIMPGLPVNLQMTSHTRWIREPFLSHKNSHGPVIVHGHTIVNTADIRPNRIGIDTGAYRSGRLTALGLEGTDRWLIETHDDGGKITTTIRST